MTATLPVRTARHNSVCAARGCLHLIYIGVPITQVRPGGAWKHADCQRPGRRNAMRDEYGSAARTGRRSAAAR
jgi:hypothetical protein